jgi:hypothetical protein
MAVVDPSPTTARRIVPFGLWDWEARALRIVRGIPSASPVVADDLRKFLRVMSFMSLLVKGLRDQWKFAGAITNRQIPLHSVRGARRKTQAGGEQMMAIGDLSLLCCEVIELVIHKLSLGPEYLIEDHIAGQRLGCPGSLVGVISQVLPSCLRLKDP